MNFPPVHAPANTTKRSDETLLEYDKRIRSFASGYAAAFNFPTSEAYFTAFIVHFLPPIAPFWPILFHFTPSIIRHDGTFNHEAHDVDNYINVLVWAADLEKEWEFVWNLDENSELHGAISIARMTAHRYMQEGLLKLDNSPLGEHAWGQYQAAETFLQSQLVFKRYLRGELPQGEEDDPEEEEDDADMEEEHAEIDVFDEEDPEEDPQEDIEEEENFEEDMQEVIIDYIDFED